MPEAVASPHDSAQQTMVAEPILPQQLPEPETDECDVPVPPSVSVLVLGPSLSSGCPSTLVPRQVLYPLIMIFISCL